MTTLTRDEIIRVLGEVDAEVVAQILKMGASEAELVEARGWLSASEAADDELHGFPHGRVAELVEMLGEPAPEAGAPAS